MIQPNQIWRCKSAYTDKAGNFLESDEAFLVLVVTIPLEIGGEEFVRIQPISRETSFLTREDILIADTSIIGFPFIIETWNEQPVMLGVLDEKVGELDLLLPVVPEQEDFTPEQLEFRKTEVRRTGYLRQSVLSVLSTEESIHEKKTDFPVLNMKIMKGIALAAVITGMVFLVWQPFKLSPEAHFDKYAMVYPNQLDIQYDEHETLRGDQVHIEGFNSGESELVVLAFHHYEKNDFEKALGVLERVSDIQQKNSVVYFYLALSELFSGKNTTAIAKLEDLNNEPEFFFESAVLYYLAMAYVRNGNEAKARSYLELLKELDPVFLDDKPKIINDLRWF